jgi:hypothetical protein
MLRSTASKVMWVGRATVFLVGLAVILALVFGVLSRAVAHSGVDTKLFHLGHSNVVGTTTSPATTPTSLLSTLSDAVKSALIVDNKSGGSALDLRVNSNNVAPMKVNSNKVVTNLNADKVDGKSSTDFYATGSKVADSTHADQADLAREAGIANAAGDSDTLDGKDSTQFVQGRGLAQRSAQTILPGQNSSDVDNTIGGSNNGLTLRYVCPSAPTTANQGGWEILNRSTDPVNLFVDDGSSTIPVYRQVSGNVAGNFGSFGQLTNPSGEFITIQVHRADGRIVTIWVFSVHRSSGGSSDCHFQWQSLLSE